MCASRLRLNPAKTEVMWLGFHQQLKNADITNISILSMQVKVSESARDLGVVLNSQLSLSSHVAEVCRAGFFHQNSQNSGPGFHLLPSRLLQLFVVRYVRRPSPEDPVDPERRRTSGHRDSSMRLHHAGYASIALAYCSSTSRLQGYMSCAPIASRSDTCIPGWGRPTRDGHWSPFSAFSCCQDMLRPTDTQQFRRSKLQCSRPACVEQFATAPTRVSSINWKHFCLGFRQPRRIVSVAIVRHRNTLTYLLTYLRVN